MPGNRHERRCRLFGCSLVLSRIAWTSKSWVLLIVVAFQVDFGYLLCRAGSPAKLCVVWEC
jgi:hypothetical protein